MKRLNEKGAAMLFAMIFTLVLTIMGVSLMFLSQSETWASMNYRLMTQSRYGAEAGLHAAANYLMNNYTPPAGAAALGPYNVGVSPVTTGGTPVILGVSMNGLGPNYPDANVQTAFNNASSNYVVSGNNNVNYTVNAELLSMRPVKHCLTDLDLTAQLWKLTSHGDINGVRNSEVEVSALLESHVVPCFNYAGYATGTGCGSISFNGGGQIDSYDSSAMTLSGGAPATQSYMGNLGSNGNVNTAANTVINGTFSSPDGGVGACAAGSVDALSGNTTAVTGCGTNPVNCVPAPGLVKLPQAVTFPLPTIPNSTPNPSPNVSNTSTLNACAGTGNCPHNGNGTPNGSYGTVSLSGGNTLTLNPGVDPVTGACVPGTYYFDSLSLSGNAKVTIAPCPGTGTGGVQAVYQKVIIDIVGSGGGTVLDLGGNGTVLPNNIFDASLIQFQYNGPGAVNIHGNGNTTGVIYAPNAAITLSGNGTIYGSVIGASLLANGNPVRIHYDRNLQNNLVTVGNWTMDTFTWSKF
jgi:Tfp pilus assembly protein PilX